MKDRDKAEKELNDSVKKAVNPDETAPKQKHVRGSSFLREFNQKFVTFLRTIFELLSLFGTP
jgi:hypothetical protein